MLLRRKKGVGNMLSCMIGLLFLAVMVFLGIDAFKQLNLAIQKSRIERSYMLAMETEGCLSPEKQAALSGELAGIGVSGISYAGTTQVPAGYGNEVVLSVTGVIRTEGIIGLAQQWIFNRGGSYEFRIYQKSTAKN